MRDLFIFQHLRDEFAGFNGDRADQYRLALFMAFPDLVDQRLKLGFLRAEDRVRISIRATGRLVGISMTRML